MEDRRGRELMPMHFQDETTARRILGFWRGANKVHIRSDLQRVRNEARGPKDQRVGLILKAHWNKPRKLAPCSFYLAVHASETTSPSGSSTSLEK